MLKRYPATHIFGMDSCNSLWDEFCYEVQEGPHPALSAAWDELLLPHLVQVVEAIPTIELVLLSMDANERLGDHQYCIEDWAQVSYENVRLAIELALRETAMDHDLTRIRPRKARARQPLAMCKVVGVARSEQRAATGTPK